MNQPQKVVRRNVRNILLTVPDQPAARDFAELRAVIDAAEQEGDLAGYLRVWGQQSASNYAGADTPVAPMRKEGP